MSSAGDVNGDGFADIIIGAPGGDFEGAEFSGVAYVVYGSDTSFSASLALDTLDGTNGYRLVGVEAEDYAGVSVGTAGDMNGDGFSDLLVGAYGSDPGGFSKAGATYVLFGSDQSPEPLPMPGFPDAIDSGGGTNSGSTHDMTNGPGDASLLITVGASGGFGTASGVGGDAGGVYDPVGSAPPPATTTFESYIYFRDNTANASGTRSTLGNAASNISTIRGLPTEANSTFDVGSISFALTQLVTPMIDAVGVQTGSLLTQTLRFTNTGSATQDFEFVRYIDGDLDFDNTLIDGGGRTITGANEEVLFETDRSGSGTTDTTFVGITGKHGTVPTVDRFEIDSYNALQNRIVAGTALDGTITGDNDGDQFVDSGEEYDISLALRNTYSLPVGGSDIYTTHTIFGSGAPSDVGAANLATVSLDSIDGINGFRIDGIDPDDHSGRSVSGAGDINGDGFDDLIIGAPEATGGGAEHAGESYVIFGSDDTFPAQLVLDSLDETNGFLIEGIDPDDHSGRAVSGAGDINGDGIADILVGAHKADTSGNIDAGEAYVVFGAAGFNSNHIELASLDGEDGFRIRGAGAGDRFGFSVSAAGDINGDGLSDLVIGAYGTDVQGMNNAGAAYIVPGSASAFPASLGLDDTSIVKLTGVTAVGDAGVSVSNAGDFNADGFDDILIGADGANPDGTSDAGVTYIRFGSQTSQSAAGNPSPLGTIAGLRFQGIDVDDHSGFSVSNAGDVNGDGFDDILVGAHDADPGGTEDAGEVYVVFGSDHTSTVTQSGTNGADVLIATSGLDIMVSGGGDDTLQNIGADDVVYSAVGDDTISITTTDFARIDAGPGTDVLELGVSGLHLDLTSLPDPRIRDIEKIEMGGMDTANTVTLNVTEVLNLSTTSNTLTIHGDSNDSLNIDAGWTWIRLGANETIHKYRQGAATLLVDSTIDTSNADRAYFPLEQLDGSNGFSLDGIENGDRTGFSVSSAGDFNGDGFDDVIVGAPAAQSITGSTYLLFGSGNGFVSNFDLNTLDGTNGFRLDGIDPGDEAGESVAAAGDVNGDGLGDIIIGGFFSDPSVTGEAYVVFGTTQTQSSTFNLDNLDGTNGFLLSGLGPGEFRSTSVGSAGDINGDGLDDIAIGMPQNNPGGLADAGESFVVFGSSAPFPATIDITNLDGTDGFRLIGQAGDLSGKPLASPGDLNGDGLDELLIGAHGATVDGNPGTGRAYLVFNSRHNTNETILGVINLADFDDNTGSSSGNSGGQELGEILDGFQAGEAFGFSLGTAGDFNGDGLFDLMIGAPDTNVDGRQGTGMAYVAFGASEEPEINTAEDLDGTTGFKLAGIAPEDHAATSVSTAGDFNGDGFDDILIGADAADPNGLDHAGEAYIIFGTDQPLPATLELAHLNGNNGFSLVGVESNDATGWSAHSAGDINGDGFDDIIIGSSAIDSTRPSKTHVVLGGDYSHAVTHPGTTASDLINGTAGPDVVVSGQGDDTLNGISFDDVVYSGAGDDQVSITGPDFHRIDAGHGDDILVLDSDGMVLDLRELSGRQLANFETIDLTGNGNNGIFLEDLDVANLSETSNTLTLYGDDGDFLDLQLGGIWTHEGQEAAAGRTLEKFQNGEVQLRIDSRITIHLSLAPELPTVFLTSEQDDLLLHTSDNEDSIRMDPALWSGLILGSWSDDHLEIDGDVGTTLGRTSISIFDSMDSDFDTVIVSSTENGATSDSVSWVATDLRGAVGVIDQGLTIDVFAFENIVDETLARDRQLSVANEVNDDFLIHVFDDNETGLLAASVGGINYLLNPPTESLFVIGGQANDDISVGELNSLPGNISILVDGQDGDDLLDTSGSSIDMTLVGGDGNDVILAGDGNNSIQAGNGDDTVEALSGSDTITGNGGNDVLLGGSGADTLYGGSGEDELNGGDGNDVLRGQGGSNDLLSGGPGNDLLDGGAGSDQVSETADVDFVATDSSLQGLGSDTLANVEAVQLFGGTSDNLIDASAFSGRAFLNGAGGNDILKGGGWYDRIFGGAGDDIIDGGFSVTDPTTGQFTYNLLRGQGGHDNISGSDGDDKLNGGTGNDDLFGGQGNDRLSGNSGNDTIDGGDGTDTLDEQSDSNLLLSNSSFSGGLGTDQISSVESAVLKGGAGDNDINASAFDGPVTLIGRDGDDTLTGGSGGDMLYGRAGSDRLYGRDGDDSLFGHRDDDTLSGGNGKDRLDGGSGNDRLTGWTGDDELYGRDGDDSLVGGEDNDTLFGGLGADILQGDDGRSETTYSPDDDSLVGGDGPDTLRGGGGQDELVDVPGDIDESFTYWDEWVDIV